MKVFPILLLVICATASTTGPGRWHSLGRAPIEIGAHELVSVKSCGECHADVVRDWSKSRHAVAWSNPIFQEGYFVETQDRCLHCHAPLAPQFAEARGTGKIELADEGVNCAVCHVRDGKVMAPSHASAEWHPFVKDTFLSSPKFCASCHQFNINNTVGGKTTESKTVAQNTYREWEAYRDEGGTKTCQQCHMPAGRHVFHGAHDSEMLTKAVEVHTRIENGEVVILISSKNVGHHLPTGDVFRKLVLEVRQPDGSFKRLKSFGRNFAEKFDRKTFHSDIELQEDSALRPGQTVVIRVGPPPVDYRVVYQFVSDVDLRRSHLLKSDLVRTVHQGRVPK